MDKVKFEINFFCSDCGKMFSDQKKFEVHQNEVHLKKEVNCPDCDEKFNGQRKMLNHKRKHKEEEVISCDDCGEKFNQGTIWKHKQTVTIYS